MKRSSNCQKFVLALAIVLLLGIICIAGCGKKDEKDTENFIPVKDRIAVFDMDGTLLAFGNSGSDTSMMNFNMNISRMMLHNFKITFDPYSILCELCH